MSDFATSVFWLLLAILFTRLAIADLRRGDDWMAAGGLALAAAYVILAMTTSLR